MQETSRGVRMVEPSNEVSVVNENNPHETSLEDSTLIHIACPKCSSLKFSIVGLSHHMTSVLILCDTCGQSQLLKFDKALNRPKYETKLEETRNYLG